MSDTPLLEIRNLGKRFPARQGREPSPWVIQELSFSVRAGEFLTIIGPSGAGKSTLLNMIAQIDTVSAGEIVFNGETVTSHDARTLASRLRPAHRLCDPGRQPAAVAHDHRQRAVSDRGAGAPERRDPGACRGALPRRRARRLRALLSARIVRRHAQARGAHPHPRLRSAGHPDGRAVRRRGCADPHAAAGRPAHAVGPRAQDHHLRHPRHHRGDRTRRSRPGAQPAADADRRRACDPNSAPAQRAGHLSRSKASPRSTNASVRTSNDRAPD